MQAAAARQARVRQRTRPARPPRAPPTPAAGPQALRRAGPRGPQEVTRRLLAAAAGQPRTPPGASRAGPGRPPALLHCGQRLPAATGWPPAAAPHALACRAGRQPTAKEAPLRRCGWARADSLRRHPLRRTRPGPVARPGARPAPPLRLRLSPGCAAQGAETHRGSRLLSPEATRRQAGMEGHGFSRRRAEAQARQARRSTAHRRPRQ